MGRLARPVLLAVAVVAVFAAPAHAAAPNTWRALGPSGAQALALAASADSPGVLYAATENRVWKSVDAGGSWAPTATGPTGLAQSMAADPGNGDGVVAAATSCKVWLSSNGGATWAQPVTGFAGVGFCMPLLAWSPSGLFALARGTLYGSNDGGLNWSPVGTPPDGDSARTLVVLPTTPATIYVGTEAGTVQRSADGGVTWSDRSEGLPTSLPDLPFPPGVNRLAVDPADGSILYADVDSAGLFRTTDGGLSWEPVQPPAVQDVPLTLPVTLATTPTMLVAVEGASAYRSTDGGASWLPATKSPGGLGSGFVTGFLADPANPDAVYMSAFGVYRSLDAGDTFNFAGNGLDKATVHAIVPVSGRPGSYLVATEGIGVQRTDDDGESWQVVNDGVIGQTLQLAAHPSDGDVFFLEAGGHLWKTTDGGAHWATSDAGIPYGASGVAVDPSAPSKVYSAHTETVYRSTDGGATWSGSALPAPGGTVRRLVVDPTDGDRVYAGTPSAFYRSTDAGVTWTRLHTAYVYDVAVANDGDVFVSVGSSQVIRFGVTSSTPTVVSTGLGDIVQTLTADPREAETLYAGTIHGVYESVDGGLRWAKLTTAGLDSQFVTDITSIAPNHLMVSAARGTAAIDLAGPNSATAQADEITATSVRFSGSGNPAGSSATAFFEYGPTAYYGSTTAPTALGSGEEPIAVSANAAGLSPATTYHYRLVVQSGGGVVVSEDATFTTAAAPPTALTGSASLLSASTARLTGTVNANGAATSYWFEYGTAVSYGQQTSSVPAGSALTPVAAEVDLGGLSPATTYHYRLVAESTAGTSFGADRQLTTPSPFPAASTDAASLVTATGARLAGSVNPNGQTTSYWFEYGATTSYSAATSAAPAGSGLGAVAAAADLTGLAPAVTYHYRLVAQSAGGTSFGADREFTTASVPPTMDAVLPPTLRSGRLSDGAVPLAVSWTATPGSSAICTYEVEKRAGAIVPTPIGAVGSTTLLTSARPASGLYYRVRALGCDGTVSAEADSPPVGLRLVQESSPAVRRSAGWTLTSAADASGSNVLRTTTPDSRVTLSFTGRALAFVAPKGTRYGAVSVRVDGAAATQIDLYRASRVAQVAVYVINFPAAGDHKVVIRARAVGSRRRVDVDAFAVIG